MNMCGETTTKQEARGGQSSPHNFTTNMNARPIRFCHPLCPYRTSGCPAVSSVPLTATNQMPVCVHPELREYHTSIMAPGVLK